ncbi:MAG: hemolysin III family protein [Deltaproteobacteria bacterium]|nr:hemolysin III family protein [Deltaproteobacteria bacterium]
MSKRAYSRGEEIANATIHGIGIALSAAGLATMVVFASLYGDAWHVVSTAVYGATLVLLYTASTLYHSLTGARAKEIFKLLDHSGIYLLIAGTYTPFTLVTLRGVWGWWLFGVVWALAVIGVALEAFWLYRPSWLSALVYVFMGWIVVVATRPLLAALPAPGIWLLAAGGFAYTGGTAFYVIKRVRYMHAIWHLWVLCGSICHFLAIVLYVVPDQAR